jgi:glycosyltransferase involved in cell wall biosynthesis
MTKPKYLIDELSVFFPCYNEEENIEHTIKKALPVIKKITPTWEILLINDGSKDKTEEKIKNLIKKHGPRLKLISHPKNRGYGASFKSGFYGAKYKWITFTDADGQFDFRDIKKLIKKQKESNADLAIGYYLGRKVPFYRKWGSTLWQLAVFILFGLRVKDIDCGFKLVKKEVIDNIPRLEAERGPFISSEFLIKAKKKGYKIVEVGVRHYERYAGSATGADLNVILAGLTDLLRLWKKLKLS